MRQRGWRLALLLVLLACPGGLVGQDGEPLQLELTESGGVRVTLGGVLDGTGISRSLEGGLPVRLRLVTELWRDRLLDSQEGRHEWRAAIRLDPVSGSYRVETEDGAVFQADTPEAVVSSLNQALSVPLRPPAPGRYYYLGRIELETVSQSDLEELRRWLRGDLAPAIGGEDEVGGALGQGIRRLFLRLLGVPGERFEARTRRFIIEA